MIQMKHIFINEFNVSILLELRLIAGYGADFNKVAGNTYTPAWRHTLWTEFLNEYLENVGLGILYLCLQFLISKDRDEKFLKKVERGATTIDTFFKW